MTVFVHMLGPASIHRGNDTLEPRAGKTSSLLYFLAYQGGWVTRDTVMALLYPETDESRARQNVRALLGHVRRFTGADEVEIEPGRLRWAVATDVKAFEEALAAQRLSLAVELYRGPLLEGFAPTETGGFDEWLETERQELERRWHEAAVELAATLDARGRHREAAVLLTRALASDPLDEAALRLQISALARAGDRTASLTAFEAFATRLETELGVEPEEATLRLADQLRGDGPEEDGDKARGEARGEDRDDRRPATAPDRRAQPNVTGSRRRRQLPPRPFIGREAELSAALTKLDDPNCRLLAFVGAGGMGKTSMALELACRLDPDDLGQVTFIPLETATDIDAAIAMIGDAIDLTFFGAGAPLQQLTNALSTRHHLLVLDNLEHLPGSAQLVAELLSQAPTLRLVTTSREQLGLRDEWVIEVRGLLVEGDTGLDAALLFEAAARRNHASFDLTKESAAVTEICQLVGGMPLALELAAGWLPTLTPAEIAASLSTGMELLQAEVADRPHRHGAMRAVLDATWQRLTPTEQTALVGLAAFTGGFTIEAALQVADADPHMLRLLTRRSLLQRHEDGRFVQHPLLWQYTRERASTDPNAWEATRARHGKHFASRLERVAAGPRGWRARPDTEDQADLANFQTGWVWAIQQQRADLLTQGVEGLLSLAVATQQLQEIAKMVAEAAAVVSAESAAHLRLLRALGELQVWSYDVRAAAVTLRRSAALAESLGERHELGLSLFYLALAIKVDDEPSGEPIDVPATFAECVTIFREVGDSHHEGRSLTNLTTCVSDPREKEGMLRQAVDLLRMDQGNHGLPRALANLAEMLHHAYGDYEPACALLDEAIEIERTYGLPFRQLSWQLARLELRQNWGRLNGLDEELAEAERIVATVGPGFGSWVVDTVAFTHGRLLFEQGELERALQVLGETRHGELGRPDPNHFQAAAGCWYALVALRAGRADEAEQAAQDALAVDDDAWCWWLHRAVAVNVLSEVRANRGEAAAAAAILRTALEPMRRARFLPSALHLCLGAARLNSARGDEEVERSLLELAAHHPAAAANTRREATLRLADTSSRPIRGVQAQTFESVLDALELAVTGSSEPHATRRQGLKVARGLTA